MNNRHRGHTLPIFIGFNCETSNWPVLRQCVTLGRFRISGMMILLIAACFICLPGVSNAQWAAEAGQTVRNAFGPGQGQGVHLCRGACGVDCPSSCEQSVTFQCSSASTLVRVRAYECGTHQGCREHDDCLDRCAQQHAAGYDCAAECHAEAVDVFGIEQAGSWAMGGGPFDAQPIRFEYTRDTPDAPEAVYTCPQGSRQVCQAGSGQCQSNGATVDPVFNSYTGAGTGMRISRFESGRVCLENGNPSSVCEPAVDIAVKGEHRCMQQGGQGSCSWYGFELDYQNADPSQPLVCYSTGGEGGDDFLGGMVAGLIKAAPSDAGGELGDLLGNLQKELASGASMDELFSGISITTAGENPVTLGGAPKAEPEAKPGVPRNVTLQGVNGHLFVPMFELQSGSAPGSVVEKQLRCTHKGAPVLETTFRLHFASN